MTSPSGSIIAASVGATTAGMLAGAEIFVTICLLPSFVSLAPSPSNTSAKLGLFRGIYTRALAVLPPLTLISSAAFGAAWKFGGGNYAIAGGVSAFMVGIYTAVAVAPVNDRLLALSKKTGELSEGEVKDAEALFKSWSRKNWVRVGLSTAATALGVQLVLELFRP